MKTTILKTILKTFGIGILASLCLLLISPNSAVSAPKTLSIMTYDIGSSGYLAYGLLGDSILQKFGTRLRAIPCGNDTGRMVNLQAGKTQFAGQGLDIYFSIYGLDRYASREWGPLDIRVVWLARHGGWSVAVRADSDIHKVQDLKGKKCGWIPGSVMNIGMEALLSYGGLIWDDVVKIQKSGYGAHIKGLLDGSVDACSGQVTSPVFYEVASGPHGLRWLSFSPDDQEAIARVQKHLPMFTPTTSTIGADIDEKHPINCFTYPYPGTISMANLNDDIAYFMTKAIKETYEIHAPKSKMMKDFWTLAAFLELIEKSSYVIVHPGSIRYLKEIGAWESGWDKVQAKRIELHKKVMDLWDEVLEESYEKKIKDKNFPNYWNEKRREKFGF
jgi:TRAP transporter TAXI family solute receptor